MKEFREHYSLSTTEIERLWEHGLIVLDSNVLLNFYRYSEKTIDDLFDLLKELGVRVWIPYQVGKEFHLERLNVITQQSKVYSDSLAKISVIENDFSNTSKNPFLNDRLTIDFLKIIEKVKLELISKQNLYETRLLEDEMLERINSVFEGKIGEMNAKVNREILNTGEDRFTSKIPPGYTDCQKPADRKFGDLVIWFEMMEKARVIGKPILFITDEKKEDWWLIKSGKIISPRPELRKEFKEKTGQEFYIYHPFKFLEYGKANLNILINPKSILEVRDLQPLQYVEKQTFSITVVVEKVRKNSKIGSFKTLLSSNGYDVTHEVIGKKRIQLMIHVPAINDFPRRIQKKFLSRLPEYGFSLVSFRDEKTLCQSNINLE